MVQENNQNDSCLCVWKELQQEITNNIRKSFTI